MCSGDTAIFNCSRDDDTLEWSYDSKSLVTLTEPSISATIHYKGIKFEVVRLFLNSNGTTSTISFTATPATNGKTLNCSAGSAASSEVIRVITDGKHSKIFGLSLNKTSLMKLPNIL